MLYGKKIPAVLREAIHLWKRRAELRPRGYARRVTEAERRLDRWLKRPVHGMEARRFLPREPYKS